MSKRKYLVEMNWYGELHKIYTSSTSEHGAVSNACYQLAARTGYNSAYVKHKFYGDKDNYKVTERKDEA